MIIYISEKLPNPDDNDSQGTEFDQYLTRMDIKPCTEPALVKYQGSNTNGVSYLSAQNLNHSLSLLVHGENSSYSQLAKDQFGDELDDYPYDKSLNEMDDIFNSACYSFTADSILFKGVRDSLPFYKILDLYNCKVGDEITFPGFLSTSVSRRKAHDFIRDNGILLIISGLQNACCIVPENTTILNAPSSNNPEQEVLLNRGTKLKVLNTTTTRMFVYEIQCEVVR